MGELAKDQDCRVEMERLDGFRLVWSLLKHDSSRVQAGAAWAICPYVEHSKVSCPKQHHHIIQTSQTLSFFPKDASSKLRNYVGGLEVIVQLLDSPEPDVQAAVALAVGHIAVNVENLSIMTDHGVVEYLSKIKVRGRKENAILVLE